MNLAVQMSDTQALSGHSSSIVNHAESALLWPDHIKVIQMKGDCMFPYIRENDYVVVDTKQQEIFDGIYALSYKENVFIRRLQLLASGNVTIIHDNPRYDNEEIDTNQLQCGMVIGRAIYLEKKLF